MTRTKPSTRPVPEAPPTVDLVERLRAYERKVDTLMSTAQPRGARFEDIDDVGIAVARLHRNYSDDDFDQYSRSKGEIAGYQRSLQVLREIFPEIGRRY